MITQSLKVNPFRFTPNLQAASLVEYFFISAVASVLIIRTFLLLTGYPQLGGNGLHIAHLLWGGLLMLVSIGILLGSLNSSGKTMAAIIGGIGFGTFIDELGKFITADNNYFYQPAIALIYLIFVIMFLLVRGLEKRAKYSLKTYSANAVENLKEVVLNDYNQAEKVKALTYLSYLDDKDPLIKVIEKIIKDTPTIPDHFSVYQQIKSKLGKWYANLVHKKIVAKLLIGLFIASSIFNLLIALLVLLTVGNNGLAFSVYGYLGALLTAGFFVVGATYKFFRKKRLQCYRYLQMAALVSLFLVQLFLFVNNQLAALLNLAFYLTIYVILHSLIKAEESTIRAIDS